MNTKILAITAVILTVLGISATSYAAKVLQVTQVNNVGCTETDAGIDYSTSGDITGHFFLGSWSFRGTYTDTCLDNFTLVEGVCGASVKPKLTNFTYGITVDCRDGATTLCSAGACI